jgi:hypothetical protein
MNIYPFLSVGHPCSEALRWTKKQLSRAGLRAMQTFDLNSARHSLEDCPCPHHGTDHCDCQMVVLLVYHTSPEPAALILHGNDGQTWLSLIDQPKQPAEAKTVRVIMQALDVKESADT